MVVHRASNMLIGSLDVKAKTAQIFHQLMISKALVSHEHRGIYSILPIVTEKSIINFIFFGQRLIDKLVKIIEAEFNSIGAYKITLPILGEKEMWQKSGRWDSFKAEMFCLNDKTDQVFCLQPTHEEVVTKLVAKQGSLRETVYPLMLYQTGPKFRDESVAGYGLLRSREFLMNDLYSFDTTYEKALNTYNMVNEAYKRIFYDKLGIDVYVVRADSGNIGGETSHEYHLLSKSGRDSIAYCAKCDVGISHDLFKRNRKPCSSCTEQCTTIVDTVEIAHTFQLGDMFTKKFGANYRQQPLVMNCFGIGIGRMIAALIDSMSPSKKALRLPYVLAPFKIAVIMPNKSQPETLKFAENVINHLYQISSLEDEIFVDDRFDNSIGKRLLAASNLGIPHILVIGNQTAKTLLDKPLVEYYKTETNTDIPIRVGDLQFVELTRLVEKLSTRWLLLIKASGKYLRIQRLSSMLTVPDRVQGITDLTDAEKILFSKDITLPIVVVPSKFVGRIIGSKKISDLTITRFCSKIKPLVNMAVADEKAIVLSPEKINGDVRVSASELVKDITGITPKSGSYSVTLDYNDWPLKSCISAVLPKGLEFSGFSQIGHIIHVNLRDELLPYKKVIGKLLLDKVTNCKTVVNKSDAIEHKYRTFELDLLAGEENYETEIQEEKLRYQLDFSQVFFNPRLSTEHKRVARRIGKRSIFYDCCAGIGPFVLPVIRNGVYRVLANDLNPNCIEYLKRNLVLNHLPFKRLKLYNMDAVEFIKTVVAKDLANELNSDSSHNSNDTAPADAHVVMNLPGMSLQFLPYFRGCLENKSSLFGGSLPFPLFIHCHYFIKAPDDRDNDWYFSEAQNLVRQKLCVEKLHFDEVRFVRNVAGRKKMFYALFQIPDSLLFLCNEPEIKRVKSC
ncbi:unnamed protein product [Thelazia callipaeda]|uniref:tRNA (guanine(37)-N1)-methyltransferase n=1 Tax=Thelazia callipaeda TaxID=103827 RepID=A0A0N5CNM9_THECL|nr:unnamed protein product [Thelazia callipaeda]